MKACRIADAAFSPFVRVLDVMRVAVLCVLALAACSAHGDLLKPLKSLGRAVLKGAGLVSSAKKTVAAIGEIEVVL